MPRPASHVYLQVPALGNPLVLLNVNATLTPRNSPQRHRNERHVRFQSRHCTVYARRGADREGPADDSQSGSKQKKLTSTNSEKQDIFATFRQLLGIEASPVGGTSDVWVRNGTSGDGPSASTRPNPSGGSNGSAGSSSFTPPNSDPLADWSAGLGDADWDDWSGSPAVPDLDDNEEVAELREAVIERRRARQGKRTRVRDEYLRPIVDATGIYNRLAIGERDAEQRVLVEAVTNQYESREALKFGAILLAVPLVTGFLVSRVVAQPVWDYAERLNPQAFALSDEQKVAGAEAMHREEVRLRLEASLGQAPALTDDALLRHLHDEAVKFSDDMRSYNRRSLLNVVSDSTTAVVLFLLLLPDTSQRAILFRTIGRVFSGLSDTAKAFIIILVTDTLLGYHSEEGWTAALRLLSYHYGWHAPHSGLQLFVATVPVLLDSLFKYWIFVGLNKVDPAAAVTLRQMDRH